MTSATGGGGNTFDFFVEQFADMRILRYRVPGFQELSFNERLLVYYLSQAAISGRDILWDQNFRFNLSIRKTLECIYETYHGDRDNSDFREFLVYMKRVMFANGIHHHYSKDKMIPDFSREYFRKLIGSSDVSNLPLSVAEPPGEFLERIVSLVYDDSIFVRMLEQREGYDLIAGSCSNFYSGVTRKEVEAFYADRTDHSNPRPVSHGLNSRLVKKGGEIYEEVYRSGGKYGRAIDKIIYWLEKAADASLVDEQRKELLLLIDYYRSGDLKKWDEYNLAWVRNSDVTVDYNNGFIETYEDPMGMKATWEAIVNYTDPEATKRTAIITANAQWFEDYSPVPDKYRKEKVTGISAKVINIAMLGGDCYP
ncbi:MAG: dipeptidyl peptidase 3, partial [Bacteroidales bacterium]|nr:dipeptidyl peptidase 3 [Bacteroidales bacterium]